MSTLKTNYIKHEDNIYEIIPPAPTETERGGIIASQKTNTDTVEVKIGTDGKAYVPEYPNVEDILNSKLEWKSAGVVTGKSYLALPTDDYNELIITVYIYTNSSKVFQNRIIKSQLGSSEDVYFIGGYYASSSDFGYANIDISQTQAKIRGFYYAGRDYSESALMNIRYR